MKKIIFFILSLALLSSCKQKINEFNAYRGSADFSKYISIGNSLMAGYADGALYHSGQLNSIPNLIAGQLKTVGAGQFVQPLVPSEYGVGFTGSTPKLILGYVTGCNNKVSLGPKPDMSGSMATLAPVGYLVDNFAVPGAKSFHIVAPSYGNPAGLMTNPPTANPYFFRFATSATSSVLSDAIGCKCNFLSLCGLVIMMYFPMHFPVA